MSVQAPRQAARAVLIDPAGRVLLLRYDENGGFWATPGGALEPGETHPEAVARELREELGIRHVALGPHLATRTREHLVTGRLVRQAERYYLARIPADAVQPSAATQADNIRESRWWPLARGGEHPPNHLPGGTGRPPPDSPRRGTAGSTRHADMRQ